MRRVILTNVNMSSAEICCCEKLQVLFQGLQKLAGGLTPCFADVVVLGTSSTHTFLPLVTYRRWLAQGAYGVGNQ